MFTKIFVPFDYNDPFKSIAQSINSALPGMPVEPAGWTNCGPKAYGMDSAGTVYSWSLGDVAADGTVTLHVENGQMGMAMAWALGNSGVTTQFPQPPTPQAQPSTDSAALAPNPFGVIAGK